MYKRQIFTNEWKCAPGIAADPCILVQIEREGLGEYTETIQKNTREITDKIIDGGVILGGAEYDSVIVKQKSNFAMDEQTIIAEARYTAQKQTTNVLFTALSNMLISSTIRDAGGFYNNAEKLSKHYFSEISVTFMPLENDVLRTFHILLTCSNELIEFMKSPEIQGSQKCIQNEL